MALKYISIDRILESVYQDEGYTYELDWNDALNWAGRALKLIGAPSIYIDKVTGKSLITPNVEIETYRGELPVDYVEMLPGGVRDSVTKEVYTYSTDKFITQSALTGDSPHYSTSLKKYSLNDNYIFTATEDTTLELAYKAIKVDDRGFPMVPDLERVIKAITAKIVYRVDHILWRKGKIKREIYEESKTEWLWYVGSANTAIRMMSVDKRDSWTKAATRLLPMIHDHSTSFASAGVREDLNIGSGK